MTPIARAAVLAVSASIMFTIEVVCVKLLANTVPVTTIMLARSMGQIAWTIPGAASLGIGILRTDRLGMHLVRGLCSLACWAFYYWSFQNLDLATATVMSFTSIMFVTALARPILGERVGWRRWSATTVGFIGVLLVARPFGTRIDPALLVALTSALFAAGIVLSTKRLSATEKTPTIMLYIGLITFGGSLPAAIPFLTVPEPWQLLWLVGMGVIGPFGMQMMIASYRLADATIIAPLGYMRLVFSTAIGWVLFNEQPSWWTASGAILVVGSALYITLHEAQLARARRAAPR